MTPPTPTITPSPSQTDSPSQTASPSPTPSNTASTTASPSATLTVGGTPSNTPSASDTPSDTATGTPPATPTLSATATALSTLPYRAVVQTNGGNPGGGGAWGCLEFADVFVFSPSMQLLSAPQLGATAASSTTYQSLFFQYGSQFGNDMVIDYSAAETSLYRAACAPAGDTWTLTFSRPSPVAFIYFFNRYTTNGPNNVLITNGSGTVTLYGQAGNAVTYAPLLSSTVTTVAAQNYGGAGVTPPSGAGLAKANTLPVYPAPGDPWQASFAAQSLAVRYINYTNLPGQCLNFRE